MGVRVEHGDMLAVLPQLAAEGVLVDSVVCDPPYHLTANKKGGSGEASVKLNTPAGRARISCGFMGKQWDGGDIAFRAETWAAVLAVMKPGAHLIAFSGTRTYHRMAVAIEDAGFEIRDQLAWVYGSGFPKSHNVGDGWGTALKPAWEPIVLARKPFKGTVAGNRAANGVGGLNIDATRIATDDKRDRIGCGTKGLGGVYGDSVAYDSLTNPLGRWPANVLHDGSDEVVAAFPQTASGSRTGTHDNGTFSSGKVDRALSGSEGSAARFFYSSKADADDRLGSKHPTVKPVDLMAYLCRLVTPEGGMVLDPFAGSGSTGMACLREGFDAILIEREAEYVADIRRRIAHVQGGGTPLFGAAA